MLLSFIFGAFLTLNYFQTNHSFLANFEKKCLLQQASSGAGFVWNSVANLNHRFYEDSKNTVSLKNSCTYALQTKRKNEETWEVIQRLFFNIVLCFWILCGCTTSALAVPAKSNFDGRFSTQTSELTSVSKPSDVKKYKKFEESSAEIIEPESSEPRYASLGSGPRAKVVISKQRPYPRYKHSPYYRSNADRLLPVSGHRRFGSTVLELLVLGGSAVVALSMSTPSPKSLAKERKKEVTGPVITLLQVGLRSDVSEQLQLFNALHNLGKEVNSCSRSSLSYAVEAVCTQLLLSEEKWMAADLQVFYYAPQDYLGCKAEFDRLFLGKRNKCDGDVASEALSEKVILARKKEDLPQPSWDSVGTTISLIVAWESLPIYKGRKIFDRSSLKRVLNIIGSAAAENKSHGILDVQVVWAPEQANIRGQVPMEEIVQQWQTTTEF